MRSRRVVAVALVVACAVLAARIAAPSSGGHFRYSAALACGVERWKVKTLQDRPRLLRAHAIPMSQLVSHERPTPLPGTRLPFELHIWRVDAAVTLVRHEPDEDFHIVLESGADQMIAESPSPLTERETSEIASKRDVALALAYDNKAAVTLDDNCMCRGFAGEPGHRLPVYPECPVQPAGWRVPGESKPAVGTSGDDQLAI